MGRRRPKQIVDEDGPLIDSWYVYLHTLNSNDFIPVFIGYSNDPYEFRRYSNRSKEWTAAANLTSNKFKAYILFDNIESEAVAEMVCRLAIYVLYFLKYSPINDKAELKRKPWINTKESFFDNLAEIIRKYRISAKRNYHKMIVDTTKRNYHPKYPSR